jgi:hypothetical protein
MPGDFDLEPKLRELAAAFKQRDMRAHLDLLRDFYVRYARAKRAALLAKQPRWEIDFVVEWLAVLGIAPFDHVYPVRPGATSCEHCVEQHDPLSGVFTRTSIEGRALFACTRCGARWIVPSK